MASPFIPDALKAIPRWVTWNNQDGHKVPTTKINDPTGWTSYETAIAKAPFNGGVGLVLTGDDDLGGIDLDACRDAETGELSDWAKKIITSFNSYTEVSPSGTGVKIFAFGAPSSLPSHIINMPGKWNGKKKPQVEVYVDGRYFTVTGLHLEGTPTEVKNSRKAWVSLVEFLKGAKKKKTSDEKIGAGSRNSVLASLAGSMRRRGMSQEAILQALLAENERRCEPPLSEGEVATIAASVGRYDSHGDDFLRDGKGNIYSGILTNIELALHKLEVEVKYNAFTDRILINLTNGSFQNLDDHLLAKVWFAIYEKFGFRPTKEVLYDAIVVVSRNNQFHPVMDYLSALEWDKKKRLDSWLMDYCSAADNEYTRAIGALVLIAAVRRIRTPGVKFDEMLVMESHQGTGKSTILKGLCPDEEWFTDDLPLNCDSKEVIERTSGKWIVEAGELQGMKKADIEHLKGFLSRQVDQARLAYGRVTTIKPRHFIVFGTTNNDSYLKDVTGNRRFWPLKVGEQKVDEIKRDRDQLWAEAVHREAANESIRLPKALWGLSGQHQEQRLISDPWEERIGTVMKELTGKILCSDVWFIVGVHDIARRTQADNTRLGIIMHKLGFERKKARFDGDLRWHYVRGEEDEQVKRIILTTEESGQITAKNTAPLPVPAPSGEAQ